MKKQIKRDVEELIIEIQQQLGSLEKKMDALLSRSTDRPLGGGQYGPTTQDRRPRERILHKAICADCNKECEVPFRPSGDRPVYCKECFSSRKGGDSFHTKGDNKPGKKDFVQPHPFDKYRKKPAFKSAKSKKRRK